MAPSLCWASAVAEFLSGETDQPPLPPLLSPVVSFLSNGRITILVGTPTPLVSRNVERCGRDRRPRLVRLDSGDQSVKACTCNGKGSWRRCRSTRSAGPGIKPEHRPYRTIDGNVRIGSVIHGIGAEIEDPQGWVWTLVETMDGTREPSAVVGEVLRAHPELPDLTPEDARQAMADLLDAGFVEDAAAPVPVSMGNGCATAWGVPLLRWMDLGPLDESLGRSAPRLRRARVLLVGVGGTGGYAAQSLVASGSAVCTAWTRTWWSCPTSTASPSSASPTSAARR